MSETVESRAPREHKPVIAVPRARLEAARATRGEAYLQRVLSYAAAVDDHSILFERDRYHQMHIDLAAASDSATDAASDPPAELAAAEVDATLARLASPPWATGAAARGRTRVGLGDLVASLAKPIAHLIDALTERMLSAEHKTALGDCSACQRRHRKLNLLCPDILTCPCLGKLLTRLPKGARTALLKASEKHASHTP